MRADKITDKVWTIRGGSGLSSNIYLVDVVEPTLIDLGMLENSESLLNVLRGLGYEAGDIVNVVFTHLHFDHTGKPSVFAKAKFFASKAEIESFKKNPDGATIFEPAIREVKKVKLEPLGKSVAGMEVIDTPGHTIGSVCLWLPSQKILFSGDTIFEEGCYGRLDLETSVPDKMQGSLNKLKKIDYKFLCAGH